MSESLTIKKLESRLAQLEAENQALKARLALDNASDTVTVPDSYRPIFDKAQSTVARYFKNLNFTPGQGMIEINDERYILVRAASISSDFFQYIQTLYSDRDAQSAFQTGQDFLFDIGHVLGIEDAQCFHQKMNLENPVEKLSAGPVHFAYTGWGYVHILPSSNPVPNEDFYLEYHHPYSFEADAWLSAGLQSDDHVCIMNAAYSSGWCEASFGIPLTAVEIACRAKGDDNCTFVMAPPNRIYDYLKARPELSFNHPTQQNTPLFFNRKASEEIIKTALKEKELMLQEIHHRVKNNLQIIVALMSLQLAGLKNEEAREATRYTQRRITSIALVHEMLYESQNLSQICYSDYMQRLGQELMQTIGSADTEVQLHTDAEGVYFGIDTAIPLGLVLNELYTNALKHGFKDQVSGTIHIQIQEVAPETYTLNFIDNGVGFPPDFSLSQNPSLGLKLIQNLLQQLKGSLEVIPTDTGVHLQITFECR